MSLWSAAQNTVDMASATLRSLQIIETLTRSGRPKEALAAARTIVLAVLEGYQGRVRGAALVNALDAFGIELQKEGGVPSPAMLDRFATML